MLVEFMEKLDVILLYCTRNREGYVGEDEKVEYIVEEECDVEINLPHANPVVCYLQVLEGGQREYC